MILKKWSREKPVNWLVYKISGSPKSQQTFWGEEEQRRECGMIFCIKNRHKRYIACDDDGGELGIRTLEAFRLTAFRVLHLRPLGQLSVYVIPFSFEKLFARTDGKNNKIFNFRTE